MRELPLIESPAPHRSARAVSIGSVIIGGGKPIVVQSMCATKTQDTKATAAQAETLREAGAGIVRIAVDSQRDAEALGEIRRQTRANLVVDLQENYRLADSVAPHVDKLRYNPGHLHHHEQDRTIFEKVRYLVEVARSHACALRIGVNSGSVDPLMRKQYGEDHIGAMVASALEHCKYMEDLGFDRFCVSLKDSDPMKVVNANKRFAAARPDIPLHLGVTEAGLPPEGVLKTRIALEQLVTLGIGDTIRVSLTLPNSRKQDEVTAGRDILEDIAHGKFRSVPEFSGNRLNIISCPSCSRVENEAFIDLAQGVKEMTAYATQYGFTIAVMGCRVNGPGETDDADLGLWCGPTTVHLKRKSIILGSFSYENILSRLKKELDELIVERTSLSMESDV